MRVDIITIFPQMFDSFLQTSLIARSLKKNVLNINIFDLRSVTTDNHKTIDGKPYGGGPGMVFRVDIIDRAIQKVLEETKVSRSKIKIILLTPQGKVFTQTISQQLSAISQLIFICGHYEGFDERIRDLVDAEISIGDYVLTGGELPAMVMVDSIARNIKGFLGKELSLSEESFSLKINHLKSIVNCKLKIENLLEYPHYTKPENYKGKKVPEVLLSGNHQKIADWRAQQSIKKTQKNRPELLFDAV